MSIVYDYYITGDNNAVGNVYGNNWVGQVFTASESYNISGIRIKMYRTGSPGNLTASIKATSSSLPTGADLCSGTTSLNAITTSTAGEWVSLTFSATAALVSGTKYAICLRCLSGNSSNYAWVRLDNTAPTYTAGNEVTSNNGGSSWVADTTTDYMFETLGAYGSSSAPADKVYSKQLVAIGGNEVWYEASAGTMSEFADAHNDIDTSLPLTAVEAFQKLFIANQTNLKVADFVNSKLTTADVGSHPPDYGTVLTGGTSGAEMVTDYITALSSACTIYGKRTTSATFTSGETVTGTDDDGNSISFTISADEDANPHWYDWTVFGNDSSFGVMPTSAYLVCRYRGRLVLSGNPYYPHQWYMSKVADPFNFVYSAIDPLTAVAGSNVDAGEVGDIVRALIPFGDDFLVFGCANSIHVLDGDPAASGSIEEVDNTVGIFGPFAWCKDEENNLWFYGSGGLYRMAGGRSRPVNINSIKLPNLVDDWGAVPSTHRIVLTYDPKRRGIIISLTVLADGTNLNYWYDFKTQGFYPETYPTQCGIFSSHYYDSDAIATRGLVLGCNDGYIRNFYNSDKNDDSGDSDTAISSYVSLSIHPLAEDKDKEGKLTSLTFELGGGAASGDFSDTDAMSYEIHVGDDAETVLEDIKDGATAFTSGTLSGTGRKARIRIHVRGAYIGIKLYNSTASQTWVINNIYGTIREVGRIK